MDIYPISPNPYRLAAGSGKARLLALLAAQEIVPRDAAEGTVALGELSLDGSLIPVLGALPAAMAAAEEERSLLCPKASGAEAAWVGNVQVIGAASLGDVVRHFTGQTPIVPSEPGEVPAGANLRDLRDVKGQERAKRALEIAAAGRHHLMFVGAPGSGKSMLAARIPGILPPLSPIEALETSMVHSLSGLLDEGGISRSRPFREPHHTASMAAIVGGGRGAKPGEISLAHNGVLFMDEFPEFSRAVLETLRQPIETGEVMVARANAHIKYPCKFMLVAAANPCKCGYLSDPARACARVPYCGEDYMGRISGPMMDRFDLRVDVPPVAFTDLDLPANGESSAVIAGRVATARAVQHARFSDTPQMRENADAEGEMLEQIAKPDAEGRILLIKAAERFGLSARGYHRVLRVARTIADLDGSTDVLRPHIAEAISFRLSAEMQNT
jgi:magnesium chelatase family protein